MVIIPMRIVKLLAAMLCLTALISCCEAEDFFVYRAYRLSASLNSHFQEAAEPDGRPAQTPACHSTPKIKQPAAVVEAHLLVWLLTPRFYQASYLPV